MGFDVDVETLKILDVPNKDFFRRRSRTETLCWLLPNDKVMRVSSICSLTVVTVDIEASLETAVEQMLDADIGSAVVTKDGEPAGIVTKSDVLRVAYRTDDPLSSIPVKTAASAPLITVGPSATARKAAEMLDKHDIHRLVVLDGLDVVGILSTTDLVRNYGGIRSQARKRADAEYDWLTGEEME